MNATGVIYPNKIMFSWELTRGTGSLFNLFSACVITSKVFNGDDCIPTGTSFNLFFSAGERQGEKKEYKKKDKN